MTGSKKTLVATTAQKIADGGVGIRTVLLKSALTDVVLGGAGVTSLTGYATAAALANLPIPVGGQDLWAVSATGGDVYVLDPESS